MREEEILNEISSKFDAKGFIQQERRIWATAKKEDLIRLSEFVKDIGFDHLSSISVTDWPKKGTFEVLYHLWSYKERILLTIKIEIERDNPVTESVYGVWGESAQIHERENHEMFGIEFKGNPDLSPLFLEDWNGPAPFRKDFDWRSFVRENYYNKDNERELVYFKED